MNLRAEHSRGYDFNRRRGRVPRSGRPVNRPIHFRPSFWSSKNVD
jgi:hypothetical protein